MTLAGGIWTGPNVEDDKTHDGVPRVEACKQLLALGADVVGINCTCGPKVPLLRWQRAMQE